MAGVPGWTYNRPVPEALEIGSRVGDFQIEAVVSESATGTLYRAVVPEGGAQAGLEIVAPAISAIPGFKDLLERSRGRTNALKHAGVLGVQEVGEADAHVYVATDWVEGVDLATLTERVGGLSFLRAAGIALQAAWVLDTAHAAGLVHGALEPRRLILVDDGGADRVLITGFVGAEVPSANGSGTGPDGWVGPPPAEYAAPEQVQGGEVGPATDIYGLGCLLYEAVTGERPFARDDVAQTLAAHVDDDPPAPSERLAELPSAFDDVIRRALAKDPARRYESAAQLARATLRAGGVVPPPESGPAVGKAGVITAWQRSLAAGDHTWSPSDAERRAARAPAKHEDAPAEADVAADADVTADDAAPPDAPAKPPAPEAADAPPPSEQEPLVPSSTPIRASRRGPGLRLAALAVAILAATATVVLLVTSDDDEPATPSASSAPSATTERPPPAREPASTADWPARDGYTVIVGVSDGNRAPAVAAAREADRSGFDAGVLDSDDYSSLEPGKFVAFVGTFPSREAAQREAARVRRSGVVAAPYVRFVNGAE